MRYTSKQLARLIDHTLLKPDARLSDIEKLCAEAVKYNFYSVCVNPMYVKDAKKKLLTASCDTKVCSVVGFPLGATHATVKIIESIYALQSGAQELDMVINIGWLKDGGDNNFKQIINEIESVRDIAKSVGAITKVILETCLLTDKEKTKACELCIEAKADFVKTSTGFASGGAVLNDVVLLSKIVKPYNIGVKASGGIRSYKDALAMLEAGATRLGCSASVKIIRECELEY